MSNIFKLFAIFIICICIVNTVEMARIPRDDAAANGAPASNIDLSESLNKLVNNLKGAFDENTLKNLLDAASNALNQGSKAVQEQFTDITNKVGAAVNSQKS